jgi:hypothetical protein
MYERGEISNYTITYVPGVGDTVTVTQGGTTMTISDSSDDYIDYTHQIHDLMGFGNTTPDVSPKDEVDLRETQPHDENLDQSQKIDTSIQELEEVEQKVTGQYEVDYSIDPYYSVNKTSVWESSEQERILNNRQYISMGIGLTAALVGCVFSAPAVILGAGIVGIGATVSWGYQSYQKMKYGLIDKKKFYSDVAVGAVGIGFGLGGIAALAAGKAIQASATIISSMFTWASSVYN